METWSAFGRRLTRLVLLGVWLIIVAPLAVGVILVATVGGWASVGIALVFWLGLALLLSIIIRFVVGGGRRLKSLAETAGRLSDGDYTARVDDPGSSPLAPVIRSFNRMAEQLERAEGERRRLLADVGHELRTPLTIVRGELEAMADGVHDPDEARIRRLLGDVGVMERLLDDLQTLSTAEAGMLKIHREPTEMVRLIDDVVEGLRPEATAAGVSLEVVPATDRGSVEAQVDPVRAREIVANVVANGIRAAAPTSGRVAITITTPAEPASDDRAMSPAGDDAVVTIEIADTGHGIPAQEIDRVFERFHKGRGSAGSGLGLTITRNLVQAHGGEIRLDSEEGVGTTVVIRLPIR